MAAKLIVAALVVFLIAWAFKIIVHEIRTSDLSDEKRELENLRRKNEEY